MTGRGSLKNVHTSVGLSSVSRWLAVTLITCTTAANVCHRVHRTRTAVTPKPLSHGALHRICTTIANVTSALSLSVILISLRVRSVRFTTLTFCKRWTRVITWCNNFSGWLRGRNSFPDWLLVLLWMRPCLWLVGRSVGGFRSVWFDCGNSWRLGGGGSRSTAD
jgi:hypothetical protein